MKVSKCPLNIESCISCRYAEGTGLSCTYSIDKPAVDNPASEEKSAVTVRGVLDSIFDCGVQSVGAFGLKEVDDKIFDDAEKMLDTLHRRKHAGEVMGVLPELYNYDKENGLKDYDVGHNNAVRKIKQSIKKWGKGE